MVMDVSYVGNALRHGYGQNWDYNAVPPYTTWNPRDGAIERFRNPTSSGVYSTNQIRSMVGFSRLGAIPLWTYNGSSNYNALQVQLNRRFGRLQWKANYTWSRTIVYEIGQGTQWVDNTLMKNTVNRPHAGNFNFGYDLPNVSRIWRNWFTRGALDGWKTNGNGAIFSGTPYTVACNAQNAPAGYWTGTPTGGIPFRCEMGVDIFLPDGQYPSRTEDPRLQVPVNSGNFRLPGPNTLGIGNTPPSLFYGPGAFNLDLSLAKQFPLCSESKTLEFRVGNIQHAEPLQSEQSEFVADLQLRYRGADECTLRNYQRSPGTGEAHDSVDAYSILVL